MLDASTGLLVKCRFAACRRKNAEWNVWKITAERWVICRMRKVAESAVWCVFTRGAGCRDGGGGRHIDQNIGLATFVCSSDLSCKFQLWKLHNLVTGSSIFQRNCRKRIMKNFMKFMKLSKLKFISLFLQADIGSVKCRSHYACIKQWWWLYAYTMHGYVYL